MRNLEDDFCIERPETVVRNLWFYPTEEIGRYASSKRSEKNRIECVAELFIREFLNRQSAEKEINRVLPDGELKLFWCTINDDFLDLRDKAEVLNGNLWDCGNNFSKKCHAAVRTRLLSLCVETDGFIPVFCGADAFFIPFHFEAGMAAIEDLSGNPITCWQAPYVELFGAAFQYKCIVHCDQSSIIPTLTGNSLMLPLYLTYLRKVGELEYNHLRLLATGAVASGRLKAVETMEKAAALKKRFSVAAMFFPESSKYCSEDSINEIPLPPLELAQVKEAVQRHIEAKGLFVPTIKYALGRLKVLCSERESNYLSWELMLQRVKNNSLPILRCRDPRNYLLCLMLESSILCHMGKTREALTLNRKAREFAEKNNFTREQLRLEIEELVEFQDEERFSDIFNIANELRLRVEKFGDPDLLMRYCGTMGQAHCYGFLAGVPGFDRDTAKECFEEALHYALKRSRELENEIDFEKNIGQDLNYIFLWHALFEPETAASESAHKDAVAHHRCQLCGAAQIGGLRFLNRIKAFSVYRRWLMDGNASDPCKVPALLKIEYREDWLAATTGKYVGALHAAVGNIAEAVDTFQKYTTVLRGAKDPILRFIQMTILAEAWRSTGYAAYRAEALDVLEMVKGHYPNSFSAWEGFLNGKSKFPGLNYWY